ncbi:hypothetical protein FRC07_006476 [Ceratobasidium sp. 392]|nr:hypothetical protein FRC07_006476 [Ceratobasidium sp. 392]
MSARSTHAQPRGGLVSGSNQQQVPPRSAAMMPPPPLHNRQLGSTSAVQAAAPNFSGAAQSTARVGQSKSSASNPTGPTHMGGFRSASRAPTPRVQQNFQNRASGNSTGLFSNVGDGRRFVPGTPAGSKVAGGGLFTAQGARR